MKIEEFKRIRENLDEDEALILKFGAVWCKPCKQIKPLVEGLVKKLTSKVQFQDIDIDESIELYGAFKAKKMIKGVPTILLFRGDSENDLWYIPDDLVTGANEKGIVDLFCSVSCG